MLLGFDTSTAPNPSQLVALRNDFAFCGCYLAPAPSHQDKSWMVAGIINARRLGFHFLPVYVGQQVVGPGSHKATAEEGAIDGLQAARLAGLALFQHGSPIYLDLENGAPFPPAEGAYTFAWLEAVREAGYTPGVYCSHVLAPHFDRSKYRIWAFDVPTTAMTRQAHLPPGGPVSLNGYDALQYRQNVMLPSLTLTVDLNAASPAALAT